MQNIMRPRLDTDASSTTVNLTNSSIKKSLRHPHSSKNSSGQFAKHETRNEYDLPDLEDMKRIRRKACKSKLKARGTSRESKVLSRERTNSKTRTLAEDTKSDFSLERKSKALDFLKQLTGTKFGKLGEAKKKSAKKVKSKARSKSKDGKSKVLVSKPKKPKKSVPSAINETERPPSPNLPKKQKLLKNKKKVTSMAPHDSKSKTPSRTQTQPVSRSTSRKSSASKTRKSSKPKKPTLKKEEYFVGTAKTVKKTVKPDSISMAKGTS